MKNIKTVVLVILLLSVSSLFHNQSVDAQDSTILSPNFTISGTLSSNHLSDYYRVEISQAGLYTIELNSTGDVVLKAAINKYSYGYPTVVSSCFSNSSNCFRILSSSQYLGSFYQLEVTIDGVSDSDLSEYIVSINRVNPITLEKGQEYSILQDRYTDSHYILNASGSFPTFRLEATSDYFAHIMIYNSYGIRVYYESISHYSYLDCVFVLDPGMYDIFIDTSSSSAIEITFQITPENIPILEPDSSMHVDFVDQDGVYVLLPLTEGTKYSIELGPHSILDVGFYIYLDPDYGMVVDDRDAGSIEIAADFFYWDICLAYTGWELNPDMQYTLSEPHFQRRYSSYVVQKSGLLIYAFSASAGSATLRLTKEQDIQLISTDVPVTAEFDGINGPFRKLYKFDDLVAGTLYKIQLTHTPANDYTLTPSYVVYTPEITDQNYLFRTRPLLSELEKTYNDDLPGRTTRLQYDSVVPNTRAYYYCSHLCETWMDVSITDGYHPDYYPFPIQSGHMEFEVKVLEPILQTVNSQFSVDSSEDTSIYSVQLEGDSLYEITVTGTNYQSEGWISLWNQTGHRLPSKYYSYSAQTDKNTRHYQYEVECGGSHNLLVVTEGNSPVTITITKMTTSIGVQYPFFIGGLAVAAVEGVIIGIVIGKVKFGSRDTG